MDEQNLKQEQLLQADKKLDGCKLIKKFGKGHITKWKGPMESFQVFKRCKYVKESKAKLSTMANFMTNGESNI